MNEESIKNCPFCKSEISYEEAYELKKLANKIDELIGEISKLEEMDS